MSEKGKVSANQSTAKGHVCMINRFDENTIMLPLTEKETTRLYNAFRVRMQTLIASGDYPEREEDGATLFNLSTARWMLSIKGGQ